MCLRISSALAGLLGLAGCAAESPPPPGDKIDCAIGAGADFAPLCTLERVPGSDEIVLHHPDGGFRRLIRDPASGALAPGDGAEPLVRAPQTGAIAAFAIGADRYRVPLALLDPPAP
jgi:hypothetical protein